MKHLSDVLKWACLVVLGTALAASAQSTAPETRPAVLQPVISPQVYANGTVMFRLRAPTAGKVSVTIEAAGAPMTMSRDKEGIWSVLAPPLLPDVYIYGFNVDGVRMLDPANPDVQPRRSLISSLFEIYAATPQYYDFQNVPHGVVRVERYFSKSLGRIRSMRVYTPPGYDQDLSQRYPVLFLLHGYGDDDATWTGAGRAPWIEDNLIAEKKAVPMVIVMPDCHAVVPPESGHTPAATLKNLLEFQGDLLGDVLPYIQGNYRVKEAAVDRAIIGPSMGGRQGLTIGLTHLNLFGWVGGMSASLPDPDATLADESGEAAKTRRELQSLWFCCGTDDPLMVQNQQFDQLLTRDGIAHHFQSYPGGHGWPTWRPALRDYLQIVFQPPDG